MKNIYKKVCGDDIEIDVKKFNNYKEFIQFLEDTEGNKIKSILSALVVISNNEHYKNLMIKDAKKYNDEQLENKKTKTQAENWIDQHEVKKYFPQLQTIQNYI